MVDFRRFALAITVLALFVGIAGAQTIGVGSPLTCQTNVTVTPQVRGEGFTENTGDITLSCTGGTAPAQGGVIPLVNITLYYNTTVTSRLLNAAFANASEALLLIDEPGSGVAGYGPTLPQLICPTPLTGCPSVANYVTFGGVTGPTPAYATTTGTPPVTTFAQAPNVYQGVVSGNSVTFFGVPALAPGTSGTRVYRITNVRVNAVPLAGGSATGAQPVQASIAVSGGTSFLLSQSALNVGFVVPSLTTSVGSALTTAAQCTSITRAASGLLTFSEQFGTAFKTRVVPETNTTYAGQINNPGINVPPYFTGTGATLTPITPNQNTPGSIYNSESNFVFPVGGGNTIQAGLADYGTRFKAVFGNIPSGVNVYVSVANIANLVTPLVTVPSPVGGTSIASYAQLISAESVNDGNAGVSGFFPNVAATDNAGTVGIAQVAITNNTGQAVWEVINTNPNTNETFSFGAYVTYASNVAQSTPAIGTSTVTLSYAPTATSGAASSSLTVPRFSASGTAATLLTINLCRTILLYPYVTNQQGFDTGLTVANTSQDPFTLAGNATPGQTGSCTFTWYGGTTAAPTTPPAPTPTGTIAPGTVWAGLASTLVPSYQGYAFAVCTFQYAHGFAFISDLGARNLAMGYLAVVLTDPGTGKRPATGGASNAEWGGH